MEYLINESILGNLVRLPACSLQDFVYATRERILLAILSVAYGLCSFHCLWRLAMLLLKFSHIGSVYAHYSHNLVGLYDILTFLRPLFGIIRNAYA